MRTYLKKITVADFNGQKLEYNLNADINFLYGKNGSGKTTLLKLIKQNLDAVNDDVYLNIPDGLEHYTSMTDGVSFEFSGQNCIPSCVYLTLDINLLSEILSLQNGLHLNPDTCLSSKLADNCNTSDNYAYEMEDIIMRYMTRFDVRLSDKTDMPSSTGFNILKYILYTVIKTDKKNIVLLLDCIDGFFHITWQNKLIDILKTINPNMQIICATHSPDTIGSYSEFATDIDNLFIN